MKFKKEGSLKSNKKTAFTPLGDRAIEINVSSALHLYKKHFWNLSALDIYSYYFSPYII